MKIVSFLSMLGLLFLQSPTYGQSKDTLQVDMRELTGAQVEYYKHVGASDLRINIFFPPNRVAGKKYPAIMFFFGGGWKRGSVRQFEKYCHHFAARGMVALAVDYRVESRQGTSPFESVQDAKSAMRWVRRNADRLGIQPDRIAAAGGSAGGHLALSLATVTGCNEPGEDSTISTLPAALILYNPVAKTTPGGFGYERLKDRAASLSPVEGIRPGTPPTLIFHGEADTTVPIANVEEFCDKMRAAGNLCELKRFPDKKHGFFNEPGIQPEIIDKTDLFLTKTGFILPARK